MLKLTVCSDSSLQIDQVGGALIRFPQYGQTRAAERDKHHHNAQKSDHNFGLDRGRDTGKQLRQPLRHFELVFANQIKQVV